MPAEYAANVVGRRIAIRWTGDRGRPWYQGVVKEWRESTEGGAGRSRVSGVTAPSSERIVRYGRLLVCGVGALSHTVTCKQKVRPQTCIRHNLRVRLFVHSTRHAPPAARCRRGEAQTMAIHRREAEGTCTRTSARKNKDARRAPGLFPNSGKL